MFNKSKKLEDRIKNALDIAWKYGQIDGAHHKMWVIDQMVRALFDSEYDYQCWVEAYETPLKDYECYDWDTGITP